MEKLTKPEPQELRLDDTEESKSSAEQWTDAHTFVRPLVRERSSSGAATYNWQQKDLRSGEGGSAADKQPQSLVIRESPLVSEQSPPERSDSILE